SRLSTSAKLTGMFLLALTLFMLLMGWQLFAKSRKESRASTVADNLVAAAQSGQIEKLKDLLAKGADVNAKQQYSDYTPLMGAAVTNQTEAMTLLLDKGANVNLQDSAKQNALMLYLISGQANLQIVQRLLDGGADVSLKDINGS